MAPFTHCSPDKPGRFNDGSFGAYYAADNFETAIAEVTHHQAQRLYDSRDEPGRISEMHELVGAVRDEQLDIRAKGGCTDFPGPDRTRVEKGKRGEGRLKIEGGRRRK